MIKRGDSSAGAAIQRSRKKQTPITTIAKPTYHIDGAFSLRNYGDVFYHPPKKLQKGLQELIIFAENTTKGNLPNGSVWIYDASAELRPEILNADIGCGIASCIIQELPYTPSDIVNILRVIDDLNIGIGHGNHFIDFTTEHPKAEKAIVRTNMVFLHSDFNRQNMVPTTYAQARQLEVDAAEKRRDYLEKLMQKLGITGGFYKDWVHNSVEIQNNRAIYRKGTIDVSKTEGEGILALNAFEGLYFYVARFDGYFSSMQHAVGKKNIAHYDQSNLNVIKQGRVRGLVVDEQLPADLHLEYQEMDYFQDKFIFEHLFQGLCTPKLVVKTKF